MPMVSKSAGCPATAPSKNEKKKKDKHVPKNWQKNEILLPKNDKK